MIDTLTYPETYEEAKKIIKTCNRDKAYNARFLKRKILAAVLITALCAAVAVAVGAVTGDFTNTLMILPAAAVIGLTSFLPWLGLKMQIRNVENDRFFRGKSEQEIMALAEAYVQSYNEYEAERHSGDR